MSVNRKDAASVFDRAAELSAAMREPLPGSRKVHVDSTDGSLRVPMREISQSPTPAEPQAEINPAITVYDTSGPYTDPDAEIDLTRGLDPLRARWIAERDDTDQLAGLSSEYGRRQQGDPDLEHLRFPNPDKPRRARPGSNVS